MLGGEQARGAIQEIREGKQSTQIRRKLRDFSEFLGAFSESKWLGQMVGPEFVEEKNMAMELLQGLQQPTKLVLTDSPVNSSFYIHCSPPDPAGSCAAGLNDLAVMAEKFASACRRDAGKHAFKMNEVDEKIKALKTLVEILSKIPDDLRHFILIRAGAIDEYKALKEFVSEEEVAAVLRRLEHFREEAVEEKATRRVAARLITSRHDTSRSPRRHDR